MALTVNGNQYTAHTYGPHTAFKKMCRIARESKKRNRTETKRNVSDLIVSVKIMYALLSVDKVMAE